MPNPAGNYPGRQIFLGQVRHEPAFAYLVTGRSDASKSRYATPFIEEESAIRIKPISPREPFDPFRHYQAVRIDTETGLLVVSNSQAPNDALFEAYKFMPEEEKLQGKYLERLLSVIGPEYDSKEKPTSRIAGVSFPTKGGFADVLGITPEKNKGHQITFYPINTWWHSTFNFAWVSTYNGDVDYRNFDAGKLTNERTGFRLDASNTRELAEEVYGMTDYIDPKYGDLRVCCVAGIRNGNGPGGWDIARVNKHNVER